MVGLLETVIQWGVKMELDHVGVKLTAPCVPRRVPYVRCSSASGKNCDLPGVFSTGERGKCQQ